MRVANDGGCGQGELAIKNGELAVAAREAEKLLKEISENTAIAEKEKHKVAVIVDQVTQKAQVRTLLRYIMLSFPTQWRLADFFFSERERGDGWRNSKGGMARHSKALA